MAGHFVLENITSEELNTAKSYGFGWSALYHKKDTYVIEKEEDRESARRNLTTKLNEMNKEINKIDSDISERKGKQQGPKKLKELKEWKESKESKEKERLNAERHGNERFLGWNEDSISELNMVLGTGFDANEKYNRSLLPPHKYLEIPGGWLNNPHPTGVINCKSLSEDNKNALLGILQAYTTDKAKGFSEGGRKKLLDMMEGCNDLKAFFSKVKESYSKCFPSFQQPDFIEQIKMSYIHNIGGPQNSNWVGRLKRPNMGLTGLNVPAKAIWGIGKNPAATLIAQMKEGRPVSIEIYKVDNVEMDEWTGGVPSN